MDLLLLASEAEQETTVLGLTVALFVAIAVIGALIVIASLVSCILRLVIFFNYWVANRQKSSGGYTGQTAALQMLYICQIPDVAVEKAGFFRALIFGNHYDPRKKKIYLRRTTFNGNNLTSVALAVQKVALAQQDYLGDKKVRSRWELQKVALFGPALFIPIALLGVIGDFLIGFTGIPMLVAACCGFAFYVLCFVLGLLTVPVEKRATKDAISMLANTTLLSPEEQAKAKKVLNVYVLSYIMDLLLALLQLIRLILKIFANIALLFFKSKK